MSGLFNLTRSVENPALPLTAARLIAYLGSGGSSTDSGVAVTEEGSLAMSAVWRATSLIGSLSGSLPLQVYNVEDNTKSSSMLLDDPHPDLTPYDLWKLNAVHRCLWGNGYSQKIRDNANRVKWLYPIMPWNVKVGKAKTILEANPSGKVFEITIGGKVTVLTPNEVLHIPGLGYDGVTGCSPIRAAAQAIGLSLAAEKSAAKLFGSGNMLSGILQTEQRLDQEAAETLQERWRTKFSGADRAHEVAVLDSGAEFQSMTMPSADAQMLESRDFSITELARFYGVPPYLMFQTEKSTSWGTALEQQATGFVKFDLHPQWLAPLEQRVTKELMLSQGKRAKYKLEGLLRGDTMARAEFYRSMRELGILTANEIRELEDRTPIDGGDMALQPMNMVPLGTDALQHQLDLEDKKAANAISVAKAAPKPAAPAAKK